MKADLVVTGIGQLLTVTPSKGPKRWVTKDDLGIVTDAAIACKEGTIILAGEESHVLRKVSCEDVQVIDAGGSLVIPGFIDPHTHLVFAGWRYDEYELRCQGKTYLEIAQLGGGIMKTVRDTRNSSEEMLVSRSLGFLDEMMAWGTTTCEIKSGYGLDKENELKQLLVVKRLRELHPMGLVSTFLGAHSVPVEYRDARNSYVELVISLLDEIRNSDLADFVDVFCDAGSFTISETRRILEAAASKGFRLKIHADEIACTGATELGCEMGAVSCDHLVHISDEGIRQLASSETVGVILPGTSVFLGESRAAPARRLLDAGAALAIGTDFNPGSCTLMNLPTCMTLACSLEKVRPEEAIIACTWNAAWAIGRGHVLGSLYPGFNADFLILDAQDYREIPYRFGSNLVKTVVKAGRVVCERSMV